MSSAPARQVSAPVFGQIQLAVNEGVAQGRDVGEKNADLAVFDASGASAILQPDTGGMAATFGEAAFVQDKDWERRLFLRAVRRKGRGSQHLADQGTQLIAHAVLVPGGLREQALDAIGTWQPGVFGDLPAVFPGDLAQDGSQVAQDMLEGFGACKIQAQTLMELVQAGKPPAKDRQ